MRQTDPVSVFGTASTKKVKMFITFSFFFWARIKLYINAIGFYP